MSDTALIDIDQLTLETATGEAADSFGRCQGQAGFFAQYVWLHGAGACHSERLSCGL